MPVGSRALVKPNLRAKVITFITEDEKRIQKAHEASGSDNKREANYAQIVRQLNDGVHAKQRAQCVTLCDLTTMRNMA